MQKALIFDIKRYCINDGPGIRLTIFLKGCPLACRWCHNPESISPQVQKLFTVAKCIRCNACVWACPEKACILTDQGIVTDTDRCTLCGKCAEVCPTRATEMSGQLRSTTELMVEIEKEIPFFDKSGGGVTFSGGEPLLSPDFLVEILDACGQRHIHRAVDTSGYVDIEDLLRIDERTDLFLYDLKLMDPTRHLQQTGVDNEKILANLTALAEIGATIQVRIPLVKGVNDDDANIRATAEFVAGLAGEKKPVSLLPYHAIAAGKHQKLGQVHDDSEMAEPTREDLARVIALFAAHGLTATVGG